MARIRTIKPEFPQSESMGRVSRDARLLFVELWTICDDSGRTRAASRMLASLLFPYDDDAPGLIETWLSELEREGCLVRYQAGGSTYIQILNWLNHQKIDKPSASKFPPFEESSRILANPRERSSEDQGPRTKDQVEEKTLSSSVPEDPTGKSFQLVGKGPEHDDEDPKVAARAQRLTAVTADAIAAFNAILGKPNGLLPSVQLASKEREKQVKRCLDVASQIAMRVHGSAKLTPMFWDGYFRTCLDDDFAAGRVGGGKGHENWRSDFDYLTTAKAMEKIFDKAMSHG